jgi:hypothetical protein
MSKPGDERQKDRFRPALGQAMNPPLVGKLRPIELAIADPAPVGIAQPLLGRASYDTTQRYYNLGQAINLWRHNLTPTGRRWHPCPMGRKVR